jgi:hypothetical protein
MSLQPVEAFINLNSFAKQTKLIIKIKDLSKFLFYMSLWGLESIPPQQTHLAGRAWHSHWIRSRTPCAFELLGRHRDMVNQ